jgi:hypothetical protein
VLDTSMVSRRRRRRDAAFRRAGARAGLNVGEIYRSRVGVKLTYLNATQCRPEAVLICVNASEANQGSAF